MTLPEACGEPPDQGIVSAGWAGLGEDVSVAGTRRSCGAGSSRRSRRRHATGWISELSLADVWNGTSWAVQSTPSPGPADDPSFTGVSCGAAGACTAVGSALDLGLSYNATLAEAGD